MNDASSCGGWVKIVINVCKVSARVGGERIYGAVLLRIGNSGVTELRKIIPCMLLVSRWYNTVM